LNELSKMKFIDPKIERDAMLNLTNKLVDESSNAIRKLTDK